ncbi:MAG: hypothetical protein R3189_06845 [Thiomicrorhabdus chilensis]|uniref:hypothetical protein n=1 Tax=Thiomicrorhabdus chilensis TaxID=63656 RepID=UPI00299DC2F4|nr:hypothetical protein [Thiomicrorhabdus chilensis]MDX1347948.1 hypothetical protein [Thiomicrorhabdus chilensis]
MKKITYTSAGLVASSLVLAMFSGCGGGGGGSSTSAVETAELTTSSAETLAVNAAEALPGCSYTSDTVVTASPAFATVYESAIKTIVVDGEESAETNSSATVRVTTINETTAGTCPTDPGYYTKVGTHDEGVDDVVYTFVNYCLGDDVESLTLNGVADVKNVGEPSDLGPIPQYAEVSTGTEGLQATEKSAEGTYTHVAKLDNFVYTYGNGDDGASVDSPSSMTADSLSILDGRSDETFSVSNVNISTYYADATDTANSDVVYNITNITYNDPDVGAVNISTPTPISGNGTDGITDGSIEVTGSNDAVLTMTLSGTVQNSFDVTFDGESLGVMDCSGLATDSLQF